jgi:hypothetical protein
LGEETGKEYLGVGFDLLSKTGKTFEINTIGWTMLLNLAIIYGWEKEGTRRPKGYGLFKKWPGNYDSNEGQVVTHKDSESIAAALQRAIQDPNLDDETATLAKGLQETIEEAVGGPLGYEISEEIDHDIIRGLISFCREGSFEIA